MHPSRPVEAFEHQYPVRIESYRVRKNSGGRGVYRGGDGIVREFRFLSARGGHDSFGSAGAWGLWVDGRGSGDAGSQYICLRKRQEGADASGEDAVRDRG